MSVGAVADPLYVIETPLKPAGLVVTVTGLGDPS